MNAIDQLTQEQQEDRDAELPKGVDVAARLHGFATKVAVDWSPEAPARIAEALQGRFVTALRIRPGVAAEEADAEYWSDEPDFDEDDMPLPPPPHKADGLADLDFGELRELDLSYFRFGDPGAESLAAATSAGRIETLDLRYCGIGDQGAAALAASGKFGNVRRLHLQCNQLTGEGVRALASLERLEALDLRYNQIGTEGAQALIEAPFAPSLKRLLLHRQDLTDAGVQMLASAPRLPTALRSYWRSV
jgi:Ran GTPase-activating protein (RanGAP) involved in mRNA processing and transport